MKKLITTLVAGFMVVSAMAGITNDMDSAKALYHNKQRVEAQAVFEAVLTDYPDADVNILASAQRYIGHSLRSQGKYVEAQAAYEKVLTDYPTTSVNILASAQRSIGDSLRSQGKYVEAQAAYEKVLTDYPTTSVNILANVQRYIGDSLRSQGKYVEAQAAYEKVLTDYPDADVNMLADAQRYAIETKVSLGTITSADCLAIVKHGDTPMLRDGAFKYARYMTPEDYIAYLTRVLMIVPATDENAEFLGRVKSQLELLK